MTHVCQYGKKCKACKGLDGGTRTFHKAKWPLYSDSAGVHPDQIPDAIAEAARLGTHISYTKDGRAIFESSKHRNEYCKKIGLVDYSQEITQRKGIINKDRSFSVPRPPTLEQILSRMGLTRHELVH